MKAHRAWLTASGCAAALFLAACAGSSSSVPPHQAANQVFTYDTYTGVMIDGWDPASRACWDRFAPS